TLTICHPNRNPALPKGLFCSQPSWQELVGIFVLMLENRSFDHMLGFSGIAGTDAASGQPTTIRGLTGTESNAYRGQSYTVAQPADETMPVDPCLSSKLDPRGFIGGFV